MTDTRKVALTEEGVREAAEEMVNKLFPGDERWKGTSPEYHRKGFIKGARFARDFYEQREAKWREYVELLTKENGALASAWTTTPTHIRAIRARALKKVAARAEELLAEERK